VANPSEAYTALQQRVEQDLAPLLERGFRILESESSDSPTGVGITLCGERVWVSLSFDIRDRVGSLYVGKLVGQHPVLPNWNLLTYLVRLRDFRGRISYELTVEQRREMSFAQIMASDFKVLTDALFRFAPRIVDDTEDFQGPHRR